MGRWIEHAASRLAAATAHQAKAAQASRMAVNQEQAGPMRARRVRGLSEWMGRAAGPDDPCGADPSISRRTRLAEEMELRGLMACLPVIEGGLEILC